MKIAFVLSEFPSVSETFVLNQITGLIDRGHLVHIYAGRPRKIGALHPDIRKYGLLEQTVYYREIPAKGRLLKSAFALSGIFLKKPLFFLYGIRTIFHNQRTLGLGTLYKISPFIGNGPYDIIFCHFGPNGNIGLLLKRAGFKGKLAVVFHGYDMTNFIAQNGQDSYKYLSANGDLFLPISETWKHELISLGFDKRKILVHRMGVDTEKFRYRPRTMNGKQISILSVARLVEKKGLRYAIEAVSKIMNKYRNVIYRIAGDGPLRKELDGFIRELNAEDRIKILGWKSQDEIIKLMDNAHIYLAPSITASDGGKEGIPVAIMEAMAQGIPVLSTFHSGIPELIEDGKSGLLVPEGDANALALKLDYLLSNPQVWQALSLAGRTRIKEDFDIRQLNHTLQKVLQGLCSN